MPGGWFTEDVHLEVVDTPDDYAYNTAGAVLVCPVIRDGALSGFLWADDTADAAGFLPAASGGGAAMNAAVSFRLRLRDAKSRGLSPSDALREIISDGVTALGAPQPIEAQPVPFETLQERAGPAEPPREAPVRRR